MFIQLMETEELSFAKQGRYAARRTLVITTHRDKQAAKTVGPMTKVGT